MNDNQLEQEVKILEKKQRIHGVVIKLSFVFIGIFLLGLTFKLFNPVTQPKLDILEAIAYEAVRLHEEVAQNSLRFPSSNIHDIENYFQSYQELGFKPLFLKNILSQDTGWQINGASVIDYKIKKVALVQYKNEKKQFIATQFIYSGTIEELPKAKEGHKNNLTYRAYSSEQINMISWVIDEKTLSTFASHLSIDELADLASHL